MHPLDQVMVVIFFIAVIMLLPIMINSFLLTIMLVMWESTKVLGLFLPALFPASARKGVWIQGFKP